MYAALKEPVALEGDQADAGLDIGLTLIGMHLKKGRGAGAAKPHDRRGDGRRARRPKFIGGARAVYDETML